MFPMLQMKNISLGHCSSSILLQDINIELLSGECLLMMGDNGAGKTTLMHSVLNQHPLIKGEIFLLGKKHTESYSRKNLAYLSENFIPPLQWSAEDFLRQALQLYQVSYPQHLITETLYEQLGHLPTKHHRPLQQASKGMRQHVSLLALFLSQRKLWLLDEPLNGLDWKARNWVLDQLKKHLKSGGCVWMTSHDINMLNSLKPRWGYLKNKQWNEYGVLNNLEEALQKLKTLSL
ncbi:MAG: ATP-binding cassette domain-containing protein [Pseudomonadota bacterium]